MNDQLKKTFHVSIVATPDAQVSPLSGLYETLNSFDLLSSFESDMPSQAFAVDIVVPDDNSNPNKIGFHSSHQCNVNEINSTDIVIVPLMAVKKPDWIKDRYPGIVNWLIQMHDNGAVLCSTCTGILLLAETGLLENKDATIHWAFADIFKRNFPKVHLRTEEVLITAGENQEFVMTGGVMSWHDLALYLIARYVGPTAAQSMAKLLMLQWHSDGQAPYISFSPNFNHDDALIAKLQRWLQQNYTVSNPVDEMISKTNLTRRSFGRRFKKATMLSPLTYVQNLRITEARKKLERTKIPVEQIAYLVGYENIGFFTRIFKRATRLTPAAYRRKFQIKDLKLY